MKITVKADDQTYTVQVGDIHDRPVIAIIEDEAFEVWPEEVGITHPAPHTYAVPLQTASRSQPMPKTATAAPGPAPTPTSGNNSSTVRAPIPGVIISVAVKAGDVVKHGQELCVLEAMKMKNVIRASRAGTIGTVHTTVQQHVKHHDVLMEYAD